MWSITLLSISGLIKNQFFDYLYVNNLHEHMLLYQLHQVPLDFPPCEMRNLDPSTSPSSCTSHFLSVKMWLVHSHYFMLLVDSNKNIFFKLIKCIYRIKEWRPRSLWLRPFQSGAGGGGERLEQSYRFSGTGTHVIHPHFTGKNSELWSHLTARRVRMRDDLEHLVCTNTWFVFHFASACVYMCRICSPKWNCLVKWHRYF